MPATDAEFEAFELMFSSISFWVGQRSRLLMPGGEVFSVRAMKYPVVAQGRRLCVRYDPIVLGAGHLQVGIVISSIPTEVPDWLISGAARSQ
ncbi:hypothetical protein ES703_108752 [subsurface metagenome]